ncbi:MAG: nucleotidyltransferase family protein [Geminicoccaceae bacterium]
MEAEVHVDFFPKSQSGKALCGVSPSTKVMNPRRARRGIEANCGMAPDAHMMTGSERRSRAMRRNEAVRLLRAHADAIRAIGATSLYLFGSTARDEASVKSDLDLFIDYDKDGDFSAIELVRLKNYISDALRIEADVTTRDGLHPLIRDEIVAEAEKVF